MAERSIDRVRATLGRETVELPWASRDALLDQLRPLDSMRPVVDQFEAVGTSRPVALKHQQRVALLQVIEARGARTTPRATRPTRGNLRALQRALRRTAGQPRA